MKNEKGMVSIDRMICGGLEANCWIIHHGENSDAFIIDPGYSYKKYIGVVNGRKTVAKAILLTHHHHDHSGAADALARELDVPVYMHAGDLPYYKGRVDAVLEDGETLYLNGESVHVLHTPGHTAGGVCYYMPGSKVSFTGDTIFNVDIGYTHFTGGSPDDMRASLREVVNKWENDVTIYPGHGDPATMKYVRDVNKEFIDMLGS
ncbi:MAG: MBL fold metallo-hydrolase [Clostridiales Family XIII bacterium]|nr:MBL fold metallo-hydrolase [Clostridiales Family XIII bacterium]